MEKVSVAHLFGPSGPASATTCGALKEQPGKMCPMRKSSLTCRHGDPVGLNSNFGKQPSELRRPTSTHTHTHCALLLRSAPLHSFCGVCHCERMPCYSSCAFCCTAGSGPGRLVTPRSGVGFHLPLWRELCNPIPSPLPPQRLSSGVIVYRANRDRSKDLASEVRGSMLTVRWSTVGFSWFVVMVTGTHD